MKKVFFSLMATLAFGLFANANTIDVETIKSGTVSVELLGADNSDIATSDVTIFKVSEQDGTLCTISCSVTIGGITYVAEAGNWFSSCEGAANRCAAKLIDIMIQ